MASGLPIPSSLSAVLADQGTIEELRRLDVSTDEDTCWRLLDCSDDFGFDFSGHNAVYGFASTATGDIFGVHVGDAFEALLDGDIIERSCPVVFLSREGFTLKVAENLPGFWKTLLSLHVYFTDLIARLSCTDKDSDHDLTRAYLMDLIDRWKREEPIDGDIREMLDRLSSKLNIGVISEKQAIENIFSAELSVPRFSPPHRK
jgi:hypothetical protein